MASVNLLDTNTTNFQGLIGNGKTFHVPRFQRDYSWTEEQWEDLWTDIQALRDDRNGRHYMGTLVVEQRSDRDFRIIDGQQRVATLSILALAVIRRLLNLADQGHEPEANRERARELRNSLIGQKDPVSLTESSRLTLNRTDDSFYQDNLVHLRAPLNRRSLARSNSLLWSCFEYFSDRLTKDPQLASGSALADLLSNVVARRLLFIQITVDDQTNAYTVFETLNARGLELSATDLLKNYLFSRVTSENDLAALERRWTRIVETVQQERFPEFLRYHLLCEHRTIRQQRLFKLVRDSVRSAEQVFALIDALERRSEAFSAFGNPGHSYWIDRPGCRPYIRDLELFRARQITPLLFACFEKFSEHDFERILRLLTVVTFRYTVIGARNTNELEPVYSQAAHEVLGGKAWSPREVFQLVKQIYVPDDRFRQDFKDVSKTTKGRGKSLVRYILAKLESEISGRPVDFETDSGTIEHILPENAGRDWAEVFPAEQQESYAYRLGNLTLLESNLNRQIGNSGYSAKCTAYTKSAYSLSRAIAEDNPEEWTPPRLEKRQADMAKHAARAWRADFDD